MTDESNDTTWPEASKRSRFRTVGRGIWNTLAIFGLCGILAMGFGFLQGYRQFSDFDDASKTNMQPERQEEKKFNFSLPPYYVGADLQPIPPLQPLPLAGAAVSLVNPFERVLVFPRISPETAEQVIADSIEWIEEESDLSYKCGLETDFLDLSQTLPLEVQRCSRPLKAYEARTADYPNGNTFLITVKTETDSHVILQLSFTGDREELNRKLSQVLSGVSYGTSS